MVSGSRIHRVVGFFIALVAIQLSLACNKSPQASAPASSSSSASASASSSNQVMEKQGVRAVAPAGQVVRSLEVLAAAAKPVNANQVLVSPMVQVRGDHWGFAKPVELTIPIDKSRLPQGAHASSLVCVLAAGGAYEQLDPSQYTIDLAKGVASVHLTRLMPMVNADDAGPGGAAGTGAGGAGVGVVANANPMETLDHTPDMDIQALHSLTASVMPNVAQVKTLVTTVKDKYRELGFVEVPNLKVQFVPLRADILAQASGGNLIEVNSNNPWTNNLSLIAHEYFHLVQQTYLRENLTKSGYAATPSNLYPQDNTWMTEGTAEYMACLVDPGKAGSTLILLRPDFGYLPLTHYQPTDAPEWPHQYETYIFFAYLNTRYDAKELVRKSYGLLGGHQFEAANLADEIESPAAHNAVSVLDHVMRETPDKSGNKRVLRRVYLDFLLDFYWHKNFEPLQSHPLPSADFGPVEAIKLPDTTEKTSVAYEISGARSLGYDSYAFGGGPLCLIKTFDIQRKLQSDEKGDLEISLKRAVSGDKNDALLVVFPIKVGKVVKNYFGNFEKPVLIPKWEDTDSCLVWVYNSTAEPLAGVTLSAKLKGPPPPTGRWVIRDADNKELIAGQKVSVPRYPPDPIGYASWRNNDQSVYVSKRVLMRYTISDGIRRYDTSGILPKWLPMRAVGEQPVLVEALDPETGKKVASVSITLVNQQPLGESRLPDAQKRLADLAKNKADPDYRSKLRSATQDIASEYHAQLNYDQAWKTLREMDSQFADEWKQSPPGRASYLYLCANYAIDAGNMQDALDYLKKRVDEVPDQKENAYHDMTGVYIYFQYNVAKAKECWDLMNQYIQSKGGKPQPWPSWYPALTDPLPTE